MAEVARRWNAPRELAVAALVGVAALPLARLFQPGGLGVTVALAIGASVTVAWLGRRLRMPPGLAWFASLVGLAWFLTVRFFPDTLFGVFPTGRSLASIRDAIAIGAEQIYNKATPVDTTPELLMFVAAGVWITVWLVDTAAIWLGNPLLAVGGGVPLFVFAGALVPSQRLWVEGGLFLLAGAWVLFDEQRDRMRRWAPLSARSRPGWRIAPAGAAAVAFALVAVALAPMLPGFGEPPKLNGRGQRVYFNPFVAIRPALDHSPTRALFRVRTERNGYFRLESLERFDGKVFSQAKGRRTVPAPSLIPTRFVGTTERVDQEVRILSLGGHWVPALYEPRRVSSSEPVELDGETNALIVDGGLRRGMTFWMSSNVPAVSSSSLDLPVTYGAEMDRYTELPGDTPSEIFTIAERIAGDEPTPFRQALALQRHLRSFEYDQEVALEHDYDDLVRFLTEVKSGYCEQFAASMAVLARALGMPSRVAIGFGMGNEIAPNQYEVTTKEAHAWTEIYFPQAGWVAFEPTPRSGGMVAPPDYTRSVPGVPDEPDPVEPPDTEPNPGIDDDPADGPDDEPAPEEPGAGSTLRGVGRALVIAAIVAGVLLGLSWAMPAAVLRRKLRRAPDARAAVRIRYADFLAWCASLGLPRRVGETPAQHAGRLAEIAPPAGPPLEDLVAAVEEALWGPPNGLDPTEAAKAQLRARGELSKTVSRPARALAAIGWGRWRDR